MDIIHWLAAVQQRLGVRLSSRRVKNNRRKESTQAAIVENLETRQMLSAVTWKGHGDGSNWSDAANWDTGVVPTSTSEVTIDAPAGSRINMPQTATIESLTIKSADLTFVGGDLAVTERVTVSSGYGVTFAVGRLTTSLVTVDNGTLIVADQQVIRNAVINLTNGGVLSAVYEGVFFNVTVNGNIDLSRENRFLGHRAANSAVIAGTVTLNGELLLGNASGSVQSTSLWFSGLESRIDGEAHIIYGGGYNSITNYSRNSILGEKVVVSGSGELQILGGVVTNYGTVMADEVTSKITFFDTIVNNYGAISAENGGRIEFVGALSILGDGSLEQSQGSTISLVDDVKISATGSSQYNPRGEVVFYGSQVSEVQTLEVTSVDRGNVTAGYVANSAYGTITLQEVAYLKLVDQYRNSTSVVPEAIYANNLFVPVGATLDLNGLMLYSKNPVIFGTVLNGTVIRTPPNAIRSTTLSNSVVLDRSSIGTIVGQFSSEADGTGNTFQYSLVTGTGSDDNASFSIDGSGNLKTNRETNFAIQNTYAIRVLTTDQSGNTLENVFVIEVHPVLVNLSLASASDSGVSSTDRITNVTLPEFNVTVNRAGLIEVDVNGDLIPDMSRNVTGAGTYSLSPASPLADGTRNVTAFFTPTGGTRVDSTPISATIDTSGPRVTSYSVTPSSQAVSAATFSFDSIVDPDSVLASDLTITGPGGSITPNSVSIIGSRVVFGFPEQTAEGTYDFVLSPYLMDLAGNAMNQDDDTTNGELVQDRYSAVSRIVKFPDLTVSSVSAPVLAYAGTEVQVSWIVLNEGLTATGSWTDQIFLDPVNGGPGGGLVASVVHNGGSLISGASYTQNHTLTLPASVGEYRVRVVVDVYGELPEQALENNTGFSPQSIAVLAPYSANVATTVTSTSNGTPIPLVGQATLATNGQPAANVPVKIRVSVDGTERILSATTDSNGNFSTTFQPLRNEVGIYSITAAYPGAPFGAAQDQFTIVGLSSPTTARKVKVIPGTPLTGQVKLKNLGGTALTGLTAVVEGDTSGLEIDLEITSDLAGSGEAVLSYTISATGTAASSSLRSFNLMNEGADLGAMATTNSADLSTSLVLRVTSTEGAVLDIPLNVTVLPALARLEAKPVALDVGMLVGTQTLVSFEVTNTGGTPSGEVHVILPDSAFMSLASTDIIESLEPGESATVILALNPLANTPLLQYAGSIGLSDGQTSLSVPFKFRAISSAVGDVQVIVDDTFTFYAEGAPRVTNATVTLLDPYDNSQVIATGLTNSTGVSTFIGVPAGTYWLKVSAPGHGSSEGIFTVVPGITNVGEVYLTNQLVTYSFQVTPTEIVDDYTFHLVSTFATEVDAPVVSISVPESMPILAVGESTQINFTISNTGLIQAENVSLIIPTDTEYELTALSEYIGTLAAGETVIVPVTVFRNGSNPSNSGICHLDPIVVSYVEIGGVLKELQEGRDSIYLPGRECDLQEAILQFNKANGGGSGAGGTVNDPNQNGDDGTGPEFPPPPPSVEIPGYPIPGVGYPTPVPISIVSPIKRNDGSIAAEVQIALDQYAVLTRTAFNGTLSLSNANTSGPLTGIRVSLNVTDENGNAAGELFFITDPKLTGGLTAVDGTGQLPVQENGSVSFTFIPSDEAALTATTTYYIGGSLSFIDPVTGASVVFPIHQLPILVSPQPKLQVNYFLQKYILGDDPLTTEIEKSEPAVLGILVTNVGGGIAKDLSIASSQPRIVRNDNGLAVNFKVVGTQVDNQTVSPKLKIEFGDIEPGQTVDANFLIESTLQGIFKDFSASFTHSAELGGTRTSLIDSVQTHELIHAGDFQFADGSGKMDYLVNDVPDEDSLPDTVYLSNGTIATVRVATAFVSDRTNNGLDMSVMVTTQATSGWTYLSLPDPGVGYILDKIVRSDGKVFSPGDAVWITDRTFGPEGQATIEYRLQILDLNTTGVYTVHYVSFATAAPVLTGSGIVTQFTQNDPATVIHPSIAVSDVDSATLVLATVKISGNYQAVHDVLGFVGNASTGNIVGSFNTATGTMSLSSSGGTATVAQFEAALRRVTYVNTSANPSVLDRTVSWQISDGSNLSDVITSSIAVKVSTNDAPTVSGVSAVIFKEDQALAAVINPNVVVRDVDNATLSSATVRLSVNYSPVEDVLGFVGNASTGNIAGSFDAATGTLSLTSAGGTATVAQFQAALRLVNYRNLSSNPSTMVRSVEYRVSDGSLVSNSVTSLVTVVAVNDATVIAGTSSLPYTEGEAAKVINPNITVMDVDSATLVSATVRISANYSSKQDVLEFVGDGTTGNIVGSYVAGRLTLTSAGGTATAAQFEAALRRVTYRNTSSNPSILPRSIAYQVSDGVVLSNIVTSTVTVATGTNEAPTITGMSALIFKEAQAATPFINGNVTVADVDNPTFAWATVRVSENYVSGEDLLGFDANVLPTTGDIVGNFNPATGTMTLTSPGGTATVAQFQTALRRVTYRNTSSNPSTAMRSVEYQVSDGSLTSPPVTSFITVVPVNNPAVVSGLTSLSYTVSQSTVPLSPTVTVSDVDSLTLASATVRISASYSAAQDVLAFVGDASTGDIVGSFNSATGTLTLISEAGATVAQFQAALRLVTYKNTSSNPSKVARTVSWQVSDGVVLGSLVTSTIAVLTTKTDPGLGGVSTLNYTGTQPAIAVSPLITVSDVDSTTLAQATVAISGNYVASQDVLSFVGNASTGNIAGSFNSVTGTLTLVSGGGTATVAQFQAALRRVTYQNTSANPSLLARTVSWQVSDGTNLSDVITSSIAVTASTNDAPTLSGVSAVIFKEDQASAAVINSNVVVGDVDNPTLSSATVRISTNYSPAEDVLGFVGNASTGNIAGSFDAATGTLSLTSAGGTATVAQFQAALRLVNYRNLSSNPSTMPRSVEYRVSDGSLVSNPVTSLVTVVAVNDAAVIAGTSSLPYTESEPAKVINPNITVMDVDSATLVSATVRISANYSSRQDVLEFIGDATTGNIVGSYVAGRLTLTSTGGTATAAQFEAALRRVTYRNTSSNPSTLPRSIAYQVSDGVVLSNIVTSTVTVATGTNDAPTLTGTSALIFKEAQATTPFINGNVTVADPDNATFAWATVRVSSNYVSGEDVLGFDANVLPTTGDIVGSFNAATGTMTLTSPGGTATVVQFQTALRRVTYRNTSSNPSTATRSVEYQVSDGSLTSPPVTSLITVVPVNNPAVVSGVTSLSYSVPQSTVPLSPTVTVSDVDSLTLASATVRISANYSAAQDVLAFVGDASTGDIVGSFNSATGTLTLVSEAGATVSQFQAALRLVTYKNTSSNPSKVARTVSWQVSDGIVLGNLVTSSINFV